MRRFVLVLIPVVLVAAGCNSSGASLVEAGGTLTGPDGKPLENVLVQFIPEGDGKALGASAVTDASGRYSLKSVGNKSGAPVGTYSVVLIDNATEDDDKTVGTGKPPPPIRIPRVYMTSKSTKLKVTIEAGKKDYDLKVEKQ